MSGGEEARRQQDDRPCPNCGIPPSVIRELNRKIEELTREVAELKRRLSAYENSNSPPSKNSLLYRAMKNRRREEDLKENHATLPKKPGRKEGHVGVTQVFTPTGGSPPIIHTMERCPRCNSIGLSVTSTERRVVVDVPEPLPYTVREHVRPCDNHTRSSPVKA